MEIRLLTPDDYDAMAVVAAQCFFGGARDDGWLRGPDLGPRRGIGVFEGGGLQAITTIEHLHLFFGQSTRLGMGGIGFVACLPESRGRGYAGQCMLRALRQMHDDGQAVSILFPFSMEWYRRFGWEWTGEERHYTVETARLQVAPETERVRGARPEDRAAIVEVYTRFARRYRGMVDRLDCHWNRLLNDSQTHYAYSFLYEGDSGPEGYIARRAGDDRTSLRDFYALTPGAYRGLLGLLKRHQMQTSTVSWSSPSDDPLRQLLAEPRIETRLGTAAQARVVDVEAAVDAWTPDAAARGTVTVAVADDTADWNHAVWRFDFEGGRARATRAHEEPQVSIDIRQFTQAFFGTPPLDQIRAAGRLDVHDERGYAALRSLLDGPPMWTADHF